MAFNDPPYVDKNAERSEESVLKTRMIFSKKNGFIAREVASDDYGVDLYNELIIDNGASSHIFPIQIKSVKKAPFIYKDDIKHFTLPFSTSRLGYLYRNMSFSGLIVLYNESSEKLYYDFATSIFNRILFDKKDNTWMSQSTVTISFPEENLLDANSIIDIHKIIRLRFEKILHATSNLHNSFDLSFSLFEDQKTNQSDAQSKKIVKLLTEIGVTLFNERKYPELIELLEKLPKKYIDKPQIAYLAAIVYTETGNVLSSDYFLKVCFKNKMHYSVEEWEPLLLQRYKTDFNFGAYTTAELLDKLHELKKVVSVTENKLNIEININQFEILSIIEDIDIDESLIKKTNRIYDTICNSDLNPELMNYQILFQTDNLISVLFIKFSDILINRKLYESSSDSFIHENEETIEYLKKSIKNILIKLNEVLSNAIEGKNDLLRGHAYDRIAKVSLNSYLCYYMVGIEPDNINETKILLEGTLKYQLKAYEIYQKHLVLPEASKVITQSYETHRLSNDWVNHDLNQIIELDEIKNRIASFSNESYFKTFNSVVDQFLQDKLISSENRKVEPFNEKQLERAANRLLNVYQLPINRKENLKKELLSINNFTRNCINKDLVVMSNQSSGHNRYKHPSKYRIVSRSTGIVYAEGYIIEDLLRMVQ